MLSHLSRYPEFRSLHKPSVKNIFILTGTNNVDNVYRGKEHINYAEQSLSNIFYKLWTLFGNAKINIISILPRAHHGKNSVVNNLNGFINDLCRTHGLNFIDMRRAFTTQSGLRIDSLFSPGHDNVHLSDEGYCVLARHMKYLAHQVT